MRYHLNVALVTLALTSFSEAKSADPVPGYSLIYSNVESLPSEDTLIATPHDMAKAEPEACARACNTMPSCQFFAIFTPLNKKNKSCQYYSSADPYNGNSEDTIYGHQVEELCGFQKDAASFAPDATATALPKKRTTYRRWAHRGPMRHKHEDAYAPPHKTTKCTKPAYETPQPEYSDTPYQPPSDTTSYTEPSYATIAPEPQYPDTPYQPPSNTTSTPTYETAAPEYSEAPYHPPSNNSNYTEPTYETPEPDYTGAPTHPSNGTNCSGSTYDETGVYERRRSVNLIPYYPDAVEEEPVKRCGTICKGYLALRSLWN